MDKQMIVQTDKHIVTLASHVNSRGQAEWKLWDSHESSVSFPDSHARWPDGRSAGHQHHKAVFLPFWRSE